TSSPSPIRATRRTTRAARSQRRRATSRTSPAPPERRGGDEGRRLTRSSGGGIRRARRNAKRAGGDLAASAPGGMTCPAGWALFRARSVRGPSLQWLGRTSPRRVGADAWRAGAPSKSNDYDDPHAGTMTPLHQVVVPSADPQILDEFVASGRLDSL